KAVGIEEIKTLDAFFEKAQKYIAYEEKQMAANVRRMRLDPHEEEVKEEKRRRFVNSGRGL
ncbi:hypothetical protein A2U01_0102394, partial [Trifolium medium]|nr:hypothetical protein [Trifolium medium]